jgi:sugar-phosphatase
VRRFEAVTAVAFDNDGVLVDSLASVDRAWRRWAAEVGVDADEVMADVHGRPSRDTVAAFVPPEAIPGAVRRIDEIELADADGVTALPGAAELLASIPAGRWAVVTSASRPLLRARLGAAGLPIPPIVVTADDVARGKPDPEGYLAAIRRLGVAPERAAVFEDSASGIAAALAADVGTVIRVGTGAPGSGETAVVADLRSVAWRGGLVLREPRTIA